MSDSEEETDRDRGTYNRICMGSLFMFLKFTKKDCKEKY